MPRRGNVPKRDVLPDPIYGNKVLTKLINQVMLDGKKGTAQTIVYDALATAQAKLGAEPSNEQRYAASRSKSEKSRRFQLSSSHRNQTREKANSRDSLDRRFGEKEKRSRYEQQTRCRTYGRLQQHRRRCQEERRHSQNGRSE